MAILRHRIEFVLAHYPSLGRGPDGRTPGWEGEPPPPQAPMPPLWIKLSHLSWHHKAWGLWDLPSWRPKSQPTGIQHFLCSVLCALMYNMTINGRSVTPPPLIPFLWLPAVFWMKSQPPHLPAPFSPLLSGSSHTDSFSPLLGLGNCCSLCLGLFQAFSWPTPSSLGRF